MTEPVDPPRLFDEPPDQNGGLREALSAARADLPNEARLAAIFGGLPSGPMGGGGGGGPGVGPSTVAASTAKTSGVAKVALAAGLAVVTAAVGYGVLSGPRTVVTSAPTTTASAVAMPPAMAAPSAKATEASTDATAIATNPVPTATQVSAHSIVPSPSASASAAPRPEIEILREAQGAAGSNPARALALADEHERAYPNGSLGQEREMIRIQALVALGRRDEARARAASFKAAHPGSAYAQRIDDVVGP